MRALAGAWEGRAWGLGSLWRSRSPRLCLSLPNWPPALPCSWTKERRVLLVMSKAKRKWVSVRPLPSIRNFPQQYDVSAGVGCRGGATLAGGTMGLWEGPFSSRGGDNPEGPRRLSLHPTALHPRAERPQVPVCGELLLRTQPGGEGHVDVHEREQE